MRSILLAALALCLLAACGSGAGAPAGDDTNDPPGPAAPTGLAALSDEFDDPASLGDWQRLFVTEQWGFDQLETIDVDTTTPGALTMMPHASTWYADWRGVLVYKEIAGDFVATTHAVVGNRAGTGAPASLYSLGGIFVRAPRDVTPATWQPGGENYVFLSIGAANTPSTWQSEVKTTVDSVSMLEIEAGGPEATIRSARVGSTMILLFRWPGQPWQVHRRFSRSDFPATLQVGFTTYTDWLTCQALGAEAHNNTLILGGDPDLIARFDYMRFAEPQVPAALVGLDLSNPAVVTDEQLLSFLGFD